MIEDDKMSPRKSSHVFDELTATEQDPLKGKGNKDPEQTDTLQADLLNDLLSDIKMKSVSGQSEMDSGTRRLKTTGDPVDFTPSGGKRLGWFTAPLPEPTSPEKNTLAEEDEQKKLKALLLLKPRSYFEDLLEGNNVRYPRNFPIDNEDYDHGEEADVGFEDHVLLDHYLKDFPKRGPVRHFMDLVVTGLSKNPHYTAAEKREYIQWYKDYFSQFSESELQQ